MAFQFTCPNGHLLEAEPEHAGQQCQCPTCGMVFVIPAPPAQAAPMAMPAAYDPAPMAPGPVAFAEPAQPAPAGPAPDVAPSALGSFGDGAAPGAVNEWEAAAPDASFQVSTTPSFPDVTDPSAAGRVAFDPTGAVAGPKMLHIPCPEGHVLETPPEMVGEDVICPHCGRQFRLQEKNSQEYKRKKREDQIKRDIKAGKNWLTWAVIIAAVVVIGLIVMIAMGTW
jgi:hypothetical protein